MEEKKQFEDWQLRIRKEREEILEKAIKLRNFIDNPESQANYREWEMMRRQLNAMREYLCALTDRCKYYGLIEPSTQDILDTFYR